MHVAILSAVIAATSPAQTVALGRPPEIEAAIKRVYPALVRIHVVSAVYVDGREVKTESSGSGVIVSADGHVVTNHHVAGRAKRIRCTLATKEEVSATLVGTDALSDIAVVKLDLHGRKTPLPVARWGDSDALRVGDTVLAMGSPRAISQSVTLGIVSNTQMTLPSTIWPSTFRLDGEETGTLVRWIGHDAQIFPGNSGGPLVNARGEIVGINEMSFGLAGAIPGNLAREVADQLLRDGEVRRSWLGLELQPLIDPTPDDPGALVSGVVSESPAEAAGLRSGDLVLSVAGRPIKVHHGDQLPEVNRLVLGAPIGAPIELIYRRDGQEHTVRVATVARGSAQGLEAESTAWGVTLREITLLAAKELQREPFSGVLVSSVRAGSPASEAKPALQPRDIVIDVAGTPVKNVKDLLARTNELTSGKGRPVPTLVGFERKTQRLLTVVKLGGRESRDRSAEATKAWIPVATQVLTPDLAEALGIKGQKGVRVTQVYPKSAAEQAGLQVGDVLLELDGEPIPATQPEDVEIFPAMVRQLPIGARAALEGMRDGKPLQLTIELPASPRSTRELREYSDTQFDFSARDLTFEDKMQEGFEESQTGALVTRVERGGWAALARMAVGDVVLSIDGEGVRSVSDLEAKMQAMTGRRPERVVFLVRRGVHTLFLELEPFWPNG